MRILITSFGYLHGPPPPAEVTLDLRHHFRDPHLDPSLRDLTAADQAVRDAVLSTPGITALITAAHATIEAYRSGPSNPGELTVAVGCAGGRHRAAAFAETLAEPYRAGADYSVAVTHRDMHRSVVNR